MTAISDRQPAVAIEYDRRGKRVTRQFTDPSKAKRFYIAKDRQGKNPRVKKGDPT